MNQQQQKKVRRKVVWGITGSGDRLDDTVKIMTGTKEQYQNNVDIQLYLSKAGAQVVRYYKLSEYLSEHFGKLRVEVDANTPFLAGALQIGRFDFLLIAPVTSNTTAKISLGIADTLLSNAAIMALKAFIPVYLMPSDHQEGMLITTLPTGQDMKLRIRKEDVEHVKKLSKMEGVSILIKPNEIQQIFERYSH